MTDESGNVTTDVEYKPFGEPVTLQEERYLYTGKERDISTGLYYYGARYYDPETGRFMTRDPVSGKTHSPQSLNHYSYCLNNPLKYIDPAGLSEKEIWSIENNDGLIGIPCGGFLCAAMISPRLSRMIILPRGVSLQDYLRRLLRMFLDHIVGLLQKIIKSFLNGNFDLSGLHILALMSYLESIVINFGDILGITGAFICFEGMGAIFVGAQGGVCLVFHPDLGWAMYLYAGFLLGPMITGGVAIIVGFWTWHGEKKFSFDDWTRWFYGPEGTGGLILSGSGIVFANEKGANLINATITGWGIGIGVGWGGGIAWSTAYYKRAPDWMIPPWLWGIVVPQGS